MFKWPQKFKSAGLFDVNIRLINRADFVAMADKELVDHSAYVDFLTNEIVICVEENDELKYRPRKDWEIFGDLLHELIHYNADMNSGSNLDEEAAVDLLAREITRLLIECGVFKP